MHLRSLRPRPRARFVPMLLATLAAAAAQAAEYTITTLAEDDLENGNCTLREALLAASTDSTHDLCAGDVDSDTIVLAVPGTYELDDATVTSAARTLVVRGAAGQPASAYVVDLGDLRRFLWVGFGSDLTIENLTLTRGLGGGHGGALLVENSDLTLRDVTITASAAANGGALAFLTSEERRLEIVGGTFAGNRATGDQASGGAVEVNLQDAGSARIVGAAFLDNRIESVTGDYSRRGAGLALDSYGGSEIELRHLRFEGNAIAAPSWAQGAGAHVRGTATGSVRIEDLSFEGNEHETIAATNGPSGLSLTLDAPAATVRRVRLLGNLGGLGEEQASIQVSGATPAVVSDVLVGNGDGAGLLLATSGTTCTLVAGNLTVAGHPNSGLRLSSQSCPLRVENSIVAGNATSSGTEVQVYSGSPVISAETLVDLEPGFVDPAAGDFRLGVGSIASEAGEASSDSVGPYDGAHGPRLEGEGLDLGALERRAIFADGFEHGDLLAWQRP